MANLHRVQDTLLAAYIFYIIDDVEFMYLSDINNSSNLDFQYDGYHFELDNFNDDECRSYSGV